MWISLKKQLEPKYPNVKALLVAMDTSKTGTVDSKEFQAEIGKLINDQAYIKIQYLERSHSFTNLSTKPIMTK